MFLFLVSLSFKTILAAGACGVSGDISIFGRSHLFILSLYLWFSAIYFRSLSPVFHIATAGLQRLSALFLGAYGGLEDNLNSFRILGVPIDHTCKLADVRNQGFIMKDVTASPYSPC